MRDLAIHESGEAIDLAAPAPAHQALLREILAREAKPRMRPGELRCATHGAPMYLRVRGGVTYACHWRGSGLAPHEVALMSVEHRMQAEYVARAADHAGLETAFEVTLPTHVRPDVVIANVTAVEVQRSHLTVSQAKSRTTKAIKGGMALSLWLSDKEPNYAPKWMYRVPSATAFAREWHRMPPLGSATVTSGLRELVTEPCRPPHRTQCPERGPGSRWCGKWHLAHKPLRHVSLDALTVGVSTGEYVPALIRGAIVLAREAEVRQFGVAWTPPARQARAAAGQGSADRYECRSPSATLDEAGSAGGSYARDRNGVMRYPATCCGERPPGRAGEQLVLACKLCPKSPTYWRRNHPNET